jgi:hypothetical protein
MVGSCKRMTKELGFDAKENKGEVVIAWPFAQFSSYTYAGSELIVFIFVIPWSHHLGSVLLCFVVLPCAWCVQGRGGCWPCVPHCSWHSGGEGRCMHYLRDMWRLYRGSS